jgi:hypothetical protein
LAEAGKVRGNDVKAIREKRNEIAEHVAGAWKAVEQ